MKEIFVLEDGSQDFVKYLKETDTDEWVSLMKCKNCAQLWRIDAWDKYQTQFAIKLNSGKEWKSTDVTPIQKAYLLEMRGGTMEESCIWAKCLKKRVKGVNYCVDHLYETGTRK